MEKKKKEKKKEDKPAMPKIHFNKTHRAAIDLESTFTKDANLAWVKNQRNMQQIIGNISTQSAVYMSQCFCALCLQGLWEYLTASWTDEKLCSAGFMCPASPRKKTSRACILRRLSRLGGPGPCTPASVWPCVPVALRGKVSRRCPDAQVCSPANIYAK